jgi:hypothetical protein
VSVARGQPRSRLSNGQRPLRRVVGALLGSAPALLGALLCASCGPRLIEARLDAGGERRLESLATLTARLPLALAPAPFAAVVAARASGLVGSALEPADRATSWQHDASLTEPPLLARQVLVYGEAARLVALDAATGSPLWSVRRSGERLNALADDGQLSVLLLSNARGDQRWLRVIDRGGRERSRLQAPELGSPALVAGTLLVPWGGRFVSAVDVGSGSELGRSGLEPGLGHALWLGADLFLAGQRWLALSPAPGSAHALPARPLPGQVELGAGSLAPSADPDVTRLFVHPRPDASGPRPYLVTYGRLALGFEGSRGSLQWLLVLPGAILAAAAGADSFALCDASGVVRVLSADSARSLAQLRLGHSQRDPSAFWGCALGASRSWPPAVSTAQPEREPEPLVDQLARVLALADPDLASAQRFLARELAARPEPEATRVLIVLASRRSADPILQSEAEDLLATRRNGEEFMLQALERSASRTADPVARAPLAALAEALQALGERRAAPLLAAQINQLGHSPQALARVARALEKLATEAEYAPLRVFFSMHRSGADQPERVEAVAAVGRTLLRIGGAAGRRLVQLALRDPLTSPEVRAELEQELPR